jgi:multiple sugar transport system permease protein
MAVGDAAATGQRWRITGARSARRWAAKDRFEKILFLLPALGIVALLSFFPFVFSLALTLMSWDFAKLDAGMEFNGLNNFVRLFGDARFLATMKNTLLYVGVGVPLQYLVALGLALLVNQDIKGQRFFRICFMMPLMISPVAVGFGVGRMMLDPAQGPVNAFLNLLGVRSVAWLSHPSLAFLSIVLVEVWHFVPFAFIILLAGLQSLPQDPLEAAAIDGASGWQIFRYITFPLLLPITVTLIFIRTIDLFKIIDVIAVMTGGGPGTTTESLTLYAVQVGLRNLDLGYAATLAWALMALVIAFAVVYLNTLRNRLPDM